MVDVGDRELGFEDGGFEGHGVLSLGFLPGRISRCYDLK
jgi:hypothetical protein